jgi:DNA-binding MarR family transcriptional regulator
MKNSRLLGQLIGILYRNSTTYFQKEFKPFGLGPSQGKVLRFIDINGRVLPKDIADYYHLDKGSVTSLIKSLEKNDFLERETHPTDKRCFYLNLSPKAKQIIPDLNVIFNNWSNRLLQGFSEADRLILIESIQKMINNVSD